MTNACRVLSRWRIDRLNYPSRRVARVRRMSIYHAILSASDDDHRLRRAKKRNKVSRWSRAVPRETEDKLAIRPPSAWLHCVSRLILRMQRETALATGAKHFRDRSKQPTVDAQQPPVNYYIPLPLSAQHCFSSPFVCLSVCLSVTRITQKLRADSHNIWGTMDHRRVH